MKDTIIRASRKDGNFGTINRQCMMDPRLTAPGFRLLMLMLNNSDGWEIHTTFYQHKLGWSPGKMTAAKKNLIKLGYLEEDKEFTGKGTKYHYKVDETKFPSEVEAEAFLKAKKSNIQKLNSKNRKSEIEVQKMTTNKRNINEIKKEENKEKEIKKEKCSVSVSSVDAPINKTHSNELTTSTEHDTTPQLKKEDFFFDYGERPSDTKVIAYVNGKMRYPVQVAQEIYNQLLSCNFMNKDGLPIKGIQRYIDAKLEDYGEPGEVEYGAESVEEFLSLCSSLNKVYIQKYQEQNPGKEMYYQGGLLDMKEAAKCYFKSISRSYNSYKYYVKDYIQKNGYKPASSFKAHVVKHQKRQLESAGTNYLNRS